jgi:hypothetical protein
MFLAAKSPSSPVNFSSQAGGFFPSPQIIWAAHFFVRIQTWSTLINNTNTSTTNSDNNDNNNNRNNGEGHGGFGPPPPRPL